MLIKIHLQYIWFFSKFDYNHLHIPVLIKKIYVFISFLYELFPLRQEKWYQEQWKGQRIRVEFSIKKNILNLVRCQMILL